MTTFAEPVRAAAVGHRNMSLVLARLDPDAALAGIDRYADLYGDDSTGELTRSVRTWRCVIASLSDDLQTATDSVSSKNSRMREATGSAEKIGPR